MSTEKRPPLTVVGKLLEREREQRESGDAAVAYQVEQLRRELAELRTESAVDHLRLAADVARVARLAAQAGSPVAGLASAGGVASLVQVVASLVDQAQHPTTVLLACLLAVAVGLVVGVGLWRLASRIAPSQPARPLTIHPHAH